MVDKIQKTDEEWQALLAPDPFSVLRGAGTERAFNGPFWDSKNVGTYVCGACKLPLYASDTKFDSGSGWPSYYASLDETHVNEVRDLSHGMVRIEATCARCDSHLGHVFPDGPPPTGQRHCINGHALIFVPAGEPNPPLVE